jgi:hypothetical protein
MVHIGCRPLAVSCAHARLAVLGRSRVHFCDVERAIQQEIRKRNYLARYELRAAEAVRSGEMETLKRLEAKYRTVASHQPDADSARPFHHQPRKK